VHCQRGRAGYRSRSLTQAIMPTAPVCCQRSFD
jgi:hypothetical protein